MHDLGRPACREWLSLLRHRRDAGRDHGDPRRWAPDLTVRFTPNGLPDVLATSELSFAHTSASAPRMVIPISALPSRYDLEASHNPMDLGSWPMGFRNLASLILINRGAYSATLSHATTSGTTSSEIAVDAAYGVPGGLLGNASAGLHVSYAPADAGMDQGEVEIG